MSLIRAKAIQMGYDATASNNFLIYQPLTPDGTFRIAVGNQGSSTDIMTVTSAGSVAFAGSTNFASLNFGSGSAGSPSLFPTGDSNTGIWFPAADTFAVSTGGTERLRITSAGSVGIGTSSPANKLHIIGPQGAVAAFPALLNQTSVITENAFHNRIGMIVPTTAGYECSIAAYGSGDSYPRAAISMVPADKFISFATGDGTTAQVAERMRIDVNGKVGIGTTSPLTNFDVNKANAGGDVSIAITNDNGYTNTGSTATLYLGATDNTLSNSSKIVASHVGGTTADHAQNMQFWTVDAGSTPVERMRIDSSGNVGIGTNSPNAKLEVYGQRVRINAATDPGIELANTSAVKAYLFYDTSGTDVVTLRHASSGNGVHVNSVGNVGIGTRGPATSLDVQAATNVHLGVRTGQIDATAIQLNAYNDGGAANVPMEFKATQFYWSGSGAERMRIDSNGNVGIGTNSPQSKMHIGSGWVGIHSDINTSTAVPAWATARITGEIHAGAGVSSGSDGGLLRLSAGGESSAAQKAGIDISGYNTTDGGPTLRFYTGAERMRITNDGRVMINSQTSSNAIFECTTKGSDGNWGFRVMNPLGQMAFALMGDGTFYTGQAASSPYNKTTGAAANVYISSDVGMMYRSTSSLRYKTNVKDMEYGLSEALTLRPVTFQNINDEKETSYGGLIAEEVEEAGLVEFVDYDDDGRPDALHYGNMVSLCIKAIQDLAQQNKELKARLDAAGL